MLRSSGRQCRGEGPGTVEPQGFWSVGSHFSMTLTPSPLLVVSNASRAFSRGKRCVTKGLTLICWDASRAIATGQLQGKWRVGDESGHCFGDLGKEHGGAHFVTTFSLGNQGQFCPHTIFWRGNLKHQAWEMGTPTALGCGAARQQARLHTELATLHPQKAELVEITGNSRTPDTLNGKQHCRASSPLAWLLACRLWGSDPPTHCREQKGKASISCQPPLQHRLALLLLLNGPA